MRSAARSLSHCCDGITRLGIDDKIGADMIGPASGAGVTSPDAGNGDLAAELGLPTHRLPGGQTMLAVTAR